MNTTLLIIILIGFLGAGIIAVLLLTLNSDRAGAKNQLKNIVSSQRMGSGTKGFGKQQQTIFETANESRVERRASSRMTLAKKLMYAQWKLSPVAFRVLEVVVSLFVFSIIRLKFALPIQIICLISGPMFMRYLLNKGMMKRFKAFDADYPQMLLSLVGLLKTGMNAMGALQAAAEGLEEGSLVKAEIDIMVERLRFGVSEDKSIGAFGEDIAHPEIELFVQALLLSRRVGGNLSDTLDRLAKQVRKRQYFRNQAIAAVGMQRGSIFFIIGILAALEVYLYIVFPQSITGALADEMGWVVWQVGLCLIGLGIFWVRQVTNIRV